MSKDVVANNAVGPVVRNGDIADAVLEACERDNPDKEFTVEDGYAYLRIETQGECIIRRETMERILGRTFVMDELSVVLTSWAGQIEVDATRVRFYLEKRL